MSIKIFDYEANAWLAVAAYKKIDKDIGKKGTLFRKWFDDKFKEISSFADSATGFFSYAI
ncbi:hypothetical protein [Campylobacter geochelonis]|uniref:Uncharacterized protein n=1 Tax=Campylobacter geochelonis TaxID=1780362 RepID=A0A128EHX8_9BACT|nr:hypothetical protein [Campylobacter geochelonis]QKF71503.1 hypothetical protein CGEO_1205 [Campylobacter geochelonis]CZE48444.1 Uncharacterised protein [Campylobacter geochelonis]